MSYYQDPGFGRGETVPTEWPEWESRGQSKLAGESIRHTKKVFPDEDPRFSYANLTYSNQMVTCVVCKNDSGGDLVPGAEVTVDAYKGKVDEYLNPERGVPKDELFWLVIDGPVTTDFTTDPITRENYTGGAATAAATYSFEQTEEV